MALQVWLPLDGDLRNLGLDGSIIVTNNGATINNTGKIGKCYSFGTGRSYLTLPKECMTSFHECSVSFWVKFLTWNTNYATVFLAGLGSTPWNNYIFGILRNNNALTFCFTISNGSSATNTSCLTPSLNLNEWYHLTFTYSEGHCKIYTNGLLTKDFSTTIIPNFANISHITVGVANNGTGYLTNMLLNDLRIYDHVLSAKEVKELSKGLILHYRLSKPMPNLISELILTTDPWLSAILNRYVYDGLPALEITNNILYSKSGNGVNNIFQGLTYKENTRYTLTVYWRDDLRTDNKNSSLYFRFKYTDGTTSLIISPAHTITGWTKSILVSNNNKTISAITTTYGNGGRLLLALLKLEEGVISTNWIPNETDTLYSAMGYNSNIELDCAPAGNQNDGTIVGAITTAVDSPRYESSYYFDGINSAILVPYNATVFLTNFTINLWFKKTELGSKNYETLFGGPSGFEMDTRANSSTTLSLYMTSTRGGNVFSPFNFNEWYMVTLVNDGTNELYYINSELKKTIEKKSMPTGNYFIGAWSTSNKQNFKGYISDFRIYCTALSAEDIKELYNTAAQVDKDGNIYAYEFKE